MENSGFNYLIQVSRRRRTVALKVLPTGELHVYAPPHVRSSSIDQFIRKHSRWIDKTRQYFKNLKEKYRPLDFVTGEIIQVFGSPHRLSIEQSPAAAAPFVTQNQAQMTVTIPQDEPQPKACARTSLAGWFAEKTAQYILPRADDYAKRLAVSPRRIKITSAEKRWGSCSRQGHLRFNWKLAMMPTAVIDYVIVHELSHLKEMNHSRKFWNVVGSVAPDFKQSRAWLKANGPAGLTPL